MNQIIFLLLLSFAFTEGPTQIKVEDSLYYQEKYFRFLANNYNQIEQGNFWTSFGPEKGIGFKAKDNFGSFILVKDWSMYSFKLTKIIFRPTCSYQIDEMKFDAEMQLVHTLDNGYYPPGKRIHLGINYLVITVPFKVTSDKNPATSKLFEFLRLSEYHDVITAKANSLPQRISPLKPIKLHHIIQHQPSLLIQSKLQTPSAQDALYLLFTQFHYISQTDLKLLSTTYNVLFFPSNPQFELIDANTVYRNWDNKAELMPKPTLMTYNSHWYISMNSLLLLIAIALLC